MSTWAYDSSELAAGRDAQFERRHGANASPSSRWDYGVCLFCGGDVCHDTQEGTVVLTDNRIRDRVTCGSPSGKHTLTVAK